MRCIGVMDAAAAACVRNALWARLLDPLFAVEPRGAPDDLAVADVGSKHAVLVFRAEKASAYSDDVVEVSVRMVAPANASRAQKQLAEVVEGLGDVTLWSGSLAAAQAHGDAATGRCAIKLKDLAPAATFEATVTLRNGAGAKRSKPITFEMLHAPKACGGNGPCTADGTAAAYTWDQTPHVVEVSVPLPPDATPRDLGVDVKPTRIAVSCRGVELLAGRLHAPVAAADVGEWSWEIRRASDGPKLFLELTKASPTFQRHAMWPCVVNGHPRVDTARFVWTRGDDAAFFGDDGAPDTRSREDFVAQLLVSVAFAREGETGAGRAGCALRRVRARSLRCVARGSLLPASGPAPTGRGRDIVGGARERARRRLGHCGGRRRMGRAVEEGRRPVMLCTIVHLFLGFKRSVFTRHPRRGAR